MSEKLGGESAGKTAVPLAVFTLDIFTPPPHDSSMPAAPENCNRVPRAAMAAALALLLVPLPSRAWNRPLDAPPVDTAVLRDASPSVPEPVPDLLPVVHSSSAETRVLLRPDPDWSSVWDSNLWTRATLFAFAPASTASDPPPVLSFAPLATAYNPSTVVFSNAPAWVSPAVDALPTSALLDAAPAWRYAFDLAPILDVPAARSNLFCNGAVLCAASDGSVAIPAASLFFRAAVAVSPSNSISFAVGYIDPHPRFGDGSPSAVMWEQGDFYVGKVALNGSGTNPPASECRAIVSFPECLASIPPDGHCLRRRHLRPRSQFHQRHRTTVPFSAPSRSPPRTAPLGRL